MFFSVRHGHDSSFDFDIHTSQSEKRRHAKNARHLRLISERRERLVMLMSRLYFHINSDDVRTGAWVINAGDVKPDYCCLHGAC